MVGDGLARDMILPDIVHEMTGIERTIFHLDGPQALRHLKLLLELPQLNALQWVFGAGRGSAGDWLGVYRQALAAGKSVQVLAHDAAEALACLDALGPRGVWLVVCQEFDDVASAEAFVAEVARRCRARSVAGTRS
jgi:hypothetical protein